MATLNFNRAGGNPRVIGDVEVMANLNKQLEGITMRTMGGLIKAAAHVRTTTEHKPPLTPVDLGSISVGKASSFKGERSGILGSDHSKTVAEAQTWVTANEGAKKKFLMMGYSANYALYVHEMVGMNPQAGYRYGPGPGRKRKYKPRQGAGARWLITAIQGESPKIIQIVRDNAQIR
jgi:hypothetical protein